MNIHVYRKKERNEDDGIHNSISKMPSMKLSYYYLSKPFSKTFRVERITTMDLTQL